MQKVISVILVLMFSNAVYADEIKLYKKGTRITFKEDTHCMDNDTALSIVGKLKLCPEQCEIKLKGLSAVHKIELEALSKKLGLQKESFLKIVAAKDITIDKLNTEALVAASEKSSQWWKTTLYITTGLVLGAGIAIGTSYLTE
jgi:hypothetical protein